MRNEPFNAIAPYGIISTLSQLENIYECRILGWIIAKAQSVLKLYNKDLSEINIESAMNLTRVTFPVRYLLGEKDRNYASLDKAFKLAEKKVRFRKEWRNNGTRCTTDYWLNVIAFPEFRQRGREKNISFVIHNDFWHIILDFSKGHRIFSLDTYMRLSSCYSIVMLLFISRQQQPITITMERLREIMGIKDMPTYERGNAMFSKILEPARQELNKKSPWTFDYSSAREGRGGAYKRVTIIPKANANYQPSPDTEGRQDTIMQMRAHLSDDVMDYLRMYFGMEPKEIAIAERYLLHLRDSNEQLAKLMEVKLSADRTRPKNTKGYLINALKELGAPMRV